MIIKTDSYTLEHQEKENTVTIAGSLRLNGMEEYAPVLELLTKTLLVNNKIIINLKDLKFLNSSGIAMLAKFTIQAREIDNASITIEGSVIIPWQKKSLINLQRLLPSLSLNIT